MMRRKLMAGLATLALAGFSLTACSGDESDPGDGDPQDDTWTAPDTDDGEMDAGEEDPDTSDPDEDTDDGEDPDAGGDDAGMEDGGGGEDCAQCVSDEFKVETEVSCAEDADERPDRCDVASEDMPGYSDWGPGSVITDLELASDEAEDCCFNIDGAEDGEPDNSLSTILALIGDVDASLKESILDGEFILLNEHQGLSSLTQSEEFDVNFFLGEFGDQEATNYVEKADSSCNFDDMACELEGNSGHDFLINPESFDEGTQPQAQVSPAVVENAEIGAGPGNVVLSLSIPDIGNVSLNINGAKIEATVDEGASDVDGDGVVLSEGKLGGYVLMKDVIGLINELLGECDCLNNPDEAMVRGDGESLTENLDEPDLFPEACTRENPPDSDECEIQCTDQVQSNTGECGSGSGTVCEVASILCNVTSTLTNVRDLDVDGDGQLDAASIGAIFEASGANIEGIADYVSGGDQQVSGGEISLATVFANQDGFVAVYDDSALGADNLVGSTEVSAGLETGVTVEVSDLSSEGDVWAVLHEDASSGDEFDADNDPVVEHYEGSGGVMDVFQVTP